MTLSTWPFRNQSAYMATVRRGQRRRKLLMVATPFVASAVWLQFSRPVVAALLILVPVLLVLVIVPKWADQDERVADGAPGDHRRSTARR